MSTEETPAAATEAAPPVSPTVVGHDDHESKIDEPQNALTAKFTAEEWTALKEFRVRFLRSLPQDSL